MVRREFLGFANCISGTKSRRQEQRAWRKIRGGVRFTDPPPPLTGFSKQERGRGLAIRVISKYASLDPVPCMGCTTVLRHDREGNGTHAGTDRTAAAPCHCPARVRGKDVKPQRETLHRRMLSKHQSVATGCTVNGCTVHGCAVNGCAVNGCTVDRCAVDGCTVNGCAVDGRAVNGCAVNGCVVNGCTVDGCTVHGRAVNGCTVNGRAANGCTVNGCVVTGCTGNGWTVDGCAVNGCAVNGRTVNGCTANGCAVNI